MIFDDTRETFNKMERSEYSKLDDVKQHSAPPEVPIYLPVRTSGTKKGWKPITLRAPVLGSFVLISLLIVALLEVLSHQSSGQNGGGVAFPSDLDSLPTLTTFGYVTGS
jgi:hypothetical protein